MRRWISSLFSVLMFACALVHGQEAPAPAKSSDSTGSENVAPKRETPSISPKPSADALLPPTKIRLVPNKNGELIEIPKGRTLEEFDKWEESRNKPKGPQAATISEVAIEGDTDEERANLKVTFTIHLHQSEQYESVPLYFNEAVLMQLPTYTGDGKEFSQYYRKDPKQGYIWWLRGRGQHRLEFQFGVPLRKSLPSRHLSISLPESPISRLKLSIPYPSVNAKVLSEQAVVTVKSDGEGKSVVEAFGLGSQLEMTWLPNIDIRPNEVFLDSQTTIRAHFEADRVLIRADQKITSLQGRFEQVTVRMPTGAELIKLDDPEKQSYKVNMEDRQLVTVTLREKASSAQLNWTLRLPAKMGKPVTIDGFDVDKARKQVGKIGFSFAEGLRVSKSTDPSVLGINAGEFPVGMGPVVQAYQFFSQPFKLVTTFDEVKPYFEVQPQLLLTATAQNLILEGSFEYHVDRDSMNRDSLNAVVLTWPGFLSEGWTIESVNEPGVVEGHSVDDNGQITVRLVTYRSGVFSVRIRARRPFKVGEEISFSLPRPKSASRLSPTKLILANAENVDTDLSARGETAFHPLPSSALDMEALPKTTRGLLKSTVYQIDTDEQLFGLRVIPQKQRIRTDSFTEAKWQDNQFQLLQHLSYNVAYERLSQVRISVPAAVDVDRIVFTTEAGNELTPEWSQSSTTAGRQIQIKLGEARIGQFKILAKFSVPFTKESVFDSDVSVKFPILSSSDEPFARTRVSLAQSDWFDAEPFLVDTWRTQLNRQDAWEWTAEGAQEELKLKLVRSTHPNETGTVSRALIRVTLEGTGEGAVRAQFRISTRASSLPIVLPDTAKTPTFFWDQRRLTEQECLESPAGSHHYVVQLPEQKDGRSREMHMLTVDYQDLFGSAMNWSDRLELRAPQLQYCSWVQVYWQAILPAGQHLLTYPRTAAPMFHWERTGFVWSRVSTYQSEELQHWVIKDTAGVAPMPDSLFSDKNGNSYTFSQFDSPKPLSFQTLSSSMVLLIGAGFSFVVGFVMLRLAVLRNALTLLFLALAVAIAGLWYAEPLELLLQPMIAGMLFPIAAVLLNGVIRRRFDDGVLSFDGQADFPPMHAFGSHYVIRQSDPNEATLHRPVLRDSESNVPIETGSGVS